MSNIKFFSYNLLSRPTTTITASSEDPFFPASNIKDAFSTKVFRSVSGTPTANVVLDFKTTETVNSILVRGNTTTQGVGFNGSLTIEGNAVDSWGAPAFSTTVSYNGQHNLGYVNFADQNYRYWRISGTGTDFLELSNLFIGAETTLSTNNIDFGWTFNDKDRTKAVENRYGQKYFDIINSQREIKGNFKLLNITEFDTLMGMFDWNKTYNPVWCIVDSSETIVTDLERFAGMFYFKSMPSIKNSAFSLYDLDFTLVEAM